MEILDAAERVVREKGANHLTIDAVAQTSGFSKGGVLYNFPSKLALLEGMVNRAIADFEQEVDDLRENIDGKNATLKAILNSRIAFERRKPMAGAYFAAIAEDPKYAEWVRPTLRRKFDQIHDEADDKEFELIIWLAFEGMRLFDMLDLMVIPDDVRERIEKRLEHMIGL